MSTNRIPADLRRQVLVRAGESCEYCRIPEMAAFASHQVDHVIAEKHGGETVANNLAVSYMMSNVRKGSDIASLDPDIGAVTPLFHPRLDHWINHFRLASGHIDGITPVGRTTARLLQFNHPDRVAERLLLLNAGVLQLPTQ